MRTLPLSRRASIIAESRTMALTERAARLQAQGVDVISLTAGEPDFETPEPVKDAAQAAIRAGKTRYTAASGIPELKQAVIDKLRKENGLDYDLSEVVITVGAKHAIHNALQALVQDGEVLIPSPYWTSYPEMVRLSGGIPAIVKTKAADGYRLDPEDLLRAITPSTVALILNNPANPTGAVYDPSRLQEIARVLEPRGIRIISDEVYEKFLYRDAAFASIAAVSPRLKELTVVVNSVSKSYAMTGWRIGYCAAAREIAQACARIQSQTTSNPCSIAQYAALAALRLGDSFPRQMRDEFARRRDVVYERLVTLPGVRCVKPEGAFYLFPDLSSYFGRSYQGRILRGSSDLCEFFLDVARVALVPGDAFGEDRCVRLSFAAPMEKLLTAADRIAKALSLLR